VNPYEAASIAVRDEELAVQSKRVRMVFACEQVVGAYYVLALGALLTGAVRVDWVEVVLSICFLAATAVAACGLVLGATELFAVRTGKLRLARAVLVNCLGVIFSAWTLVSYLSQFLFS
jgi:hypothetical protein